MSRAGKLSDYPRTCSIDVSMHMFCLARSIVTPRGCRLQNLIWICWVVLLAVRNGCVRVNFTFLFGPQKEDKCPAFAL